MGKTRLALEAARLQIGRYTDGVIFVPLAPLSSPSDIVTTIAENIGFIFHGENPPAQQLIDFLRERSMLLVLDNFEHLLDGVQLVADLIQVTPQVRVLTTSRERLNLRGETVYNLRGLEFPTWETPEDALQYDAVKLFMQSANRVRADFTLQSHDLAYLARICRLTEGLPLGIELAAGWVDVLSLEQIAAEIQKSIDILETDIRDVPERQRSIRATFDYTWERLTGDEQAVFMRLSVFRGGFTIQAAQTVAGATVRSLRQLVNKALVQVSPDIRHNIHELLRQFGEEKLFASDEQTTIQAKHAAYFTDFMEERKQDIRGSRQLEALQLIDPDFENVRSAWLYVVNQQEWDQLPKFLHSLWFYLDTRSRWQGAVELLEHAVKVLESAPATPVTELTLGRVRARLGWFYTDVGLHERGTVISDEAIHLLRQHSSPEDLLSALAARNNLAQFQNWQDVELSVCEEGVQLARSIGDKGWEGHFLCDIGTKRVESNDLESALQFAKEALSILETLGDHRNLWSAYVLWFNINLHKEDYEQARHWAKKAQANIEAIGHRSWTALTWIGFGLIDMHEHNYTAARLHFIKALQTFWNVGYKWVASFSLRFIAQTYADQNELDYALEILGTMYKHMVSYNQTDELAKALRDQLETQLEPERFAAAWARGEGRELSAVVNELLAELADD
jgi:predicted ATPase